MPRKKRSLATSVSALAAGRIARRERRRDQSRLKFIDAARRVLVRSGVAALTLDAVAEEVGVSKTALYYYFSSQEALLFELVFVAAETEARAIRDAVERTKDGKILRAIVRETVNVCAPNLDDF